MSLTRGALSPVSTAVRLLAVMVLIFGLAYPLALTGLAAIAAPERAAGSPVREADGREVGSALIGQSFLAADGAPDPRWFQPRPSAAGDGYDAMSSGGSNLGPQNPELVEQIRQRRTEVAAFEGVDPAAVPVDALTASASGLDPQISPAYAALQAPRVAKAWGISEETVREAIERSTDRPAVFLPGQDAVNVLRLNLAVKQAAAALRDGA